MSANLPEPVMNADSRPFWEAAARQELLIRQCTACGARHFMPRSLCPACWSDDLRWIKCTGLGKVHSFTIIRRAPLPAFAGKVPYVVALIDLEEGARMMANIVGNTALETAIGDSVQVCFEARGGGMVPQFVRTAERQ